MPLNGGIHTIKADMTPDPKIRSQELGNAPLENTAFKNFVFEDIDKPNVA